MAERIFLHMRDTSKPIRAQLTPDFGERITAARQSQVEYDRHVAPIVAWAQAEYGTRRAAHDALTRLRYDDGTSDTAYQLLERAIIALR